MNSIFVTNERVIVGGVEHTIGGWGKYEIERRREYGDSSEHYDARTYVHAKDVVQSIIGSRKPSVLRRAILRLANALKPLEERLCQGRIEYNITIPPMTSIDLQNYDDMHESDPIALEELSNDVRAIAAAIGLKNLPELPDATMLPLPSDPVSTDDSQKIIQLEETVAPYIEKIEIIHTALVQQLEMTTAAVVVIST